MTKYKYEVCKEACSRKPYCFCPEEHEFHKQIANVNEWVRRYFHLEGFKDGFQAGLNFNR